MNVYYKITYPNGLKELCTKNYLWPRYNRGWYGACTKAPPVAQVDAYNDRDGYCLVQFPIGPTAIPSGLQDGTVLTVMAQANYNTLLVQLVAQATDGSNGIWAGAIMAHKFDPPPMPPEG